MTEEKGCVLLYLTAATETVYSYKSTYIQYMCPASHKVSIAKIVPSTFTLFNGAARERKNQKRRPTEDDVKTR